MGILADIGRSNLGQVSQNVLGEMNQFARTQSLTRLEDIEAKKREMDVKRLQEEEAARKAPVNMNFHPLMTVYEPGTPEHENLKKTLFNDTGADEHGNTTAENRDKGLQTFVRNTQAMQGVYKTKADAMNAEWTNTLKKIQEAKAIGDQDKVDQLTTKAANLEKMAIIASGKYVEWDKANKKLEQDKIEEARREKKDDARFNQAEKRLDQTEQRLNLEADRLAETERHNRETEAKSGAEAKEVTRKNRSLKEARAEVDKSYGIGNFLEQAKEPLIYQKAMQAKAKVEDIIENYGSYGLSKEPTPGKAAEMAKGIIENGYKEAAAPTQKPTKEQTIWQSLFGTPEKK